MVRVWRDYQTDMGRTYPMFALSVAQLNDVDDDTPPLDLLPNSITAEIRDVKYPCGVKELTPRSIILWSSNGGQFKVTYPRPFSLSLRDYLTVNTSVSAFEFVGERIKYGRLKRMLDNV